MNQKLLKGALVVLGAIVLSSVGLFAADTFQGVDRGLSGLAGQGAGLCRSGMSLVKNGEHSFCIDTFEVSAGANCTYRDPKNVMESEENSAAASCAPETKDGETPWRFVSLTQAQRICASTGKRLPTSEEWYAAALGTPPETCIITNDGNPVPAGSARTCVSSAGAFDMVGNVWEWVDETVTNGTYAERTLPQSGYVSSVDAEGIAITTLSDEEQLYGSDYFWSKEEGVFGMIRGGFFGGGKDAGLYAVNASVQTSFASPGVGFRCAEDLI